MKANYHTHTYYCGHAEGTEEELVIVAKEKGFEVLGFSEHVPLPWFRWHLIKAIPISFRSMRSFLSWSKSFVFNGNGFRMAYKYKNKHLKEIDRLKKEYRDEITLFKGFECDYLEEYVSYYQKLLESKQVDYLILGNHFYKNSVLLCHYGRKGLSKTGLKNYTDTSIKALETKLFRYFAHPDIFMSGYLKWDQHTIDCSYKICNVAKDLDIPLELNAGGLRQNKRKINNQLVVSYPYESFWDIVSEVGNKVIIGLDIHNIEHFDDEIINQLKTFVRRKKLNIIDYIEIK